MKLVSIALLSLSAISVSQAASITLSSINGGAPTGSERVNFDSLSLGNANQAVNSDLSVSFTGTNTGVFQGSSSGLYAAPYLSNNNGVGFGPGGSNQANGVDATRYLSAGKDGTVTFSFTSAQKYLGLLWGSVDGYNTIVFKLGATTLDTFTGTNVWNFANGDRGANGTFYVNFNAVGGASFDTVVLMSSSNAFEVDNLSYDKRSRVPDAASTVGLAGLSLLALAALRRRA